jgi:hypothetical protein
VPRDLPIDHLLGDDFGRVPLVMDGHRVLLNIIPEEAVVVAGLLRRREAEMGHADAGGPELCSRPTPP